MWLPLAEWWYNTHFHTSIQSTPYEVVYNQPPPVHFPYLAGDSLVDEVDKSLQRREEMLKVVKFHLNRAQDRMKAQADSHRSERQFDIGDWVLFKLQPYRQQSVKRRANQKLSQRFFGPNQIVDKIGKVTYKLRLPDGSEIHDVFMYLNSRNIMVHFQLLCRFRLGYKALMLVTFIDLKAFWQEEW